MRRLIFLLYDPVKFFIVAFALLVALPAALLIPSGASAGSTSYPAPYTGGAPVVKYFYMNDGSTRTITCTGAVIKQGPGGTAYREGWVNPDNIASIQIASDVRGQLGYGPSNPFGSDNNCPKPQATQNQNSQPSQTYSNHDTKYQKNIYCPNNHNGRCYINDPPQAFTSSYMPPTAISTYQSSQPANNTKVVYVNARPTKSAPPQTLPNTGPSDVLAVGGLTTVFASLGHYFYRRRF